MVLNEEGQVIGDLQNLCLNTFPTFLHPFQDVFEETLGNQLPPHQECNMVIELEENVTLPRSKAYPLNKMEMDMLKEYVEENLKKGFIRRSNSSCSSPLFFVKKEGSKPRPCGNYQNLNAITRKN